MPPPKDYALKHKTVNGGRLNLINFPLMDYQFTLNGPVVGFKDQYVKPGIKTGQIKFY